MMPTPVPVATPTPPPILGSRENPVPMGTSVAVRFTEDDHWHVTVLGTTPDATDDVLVENMFNDPPKRGYQFYSATIRAEYLGPGSTRFDGISRLRTLGNKGVVYTTYDDSCGVIPKELPDPELFTNGTIEGKECWQIATSDVDSLVMFMASSSYSDDRRIWFSLRPISVIGEGVDPTPIIVSSTGGRESCGNVRDSMTERINGNRTHDQMLVRATWVGFVDSEVKEAELMDAIADIQNSLTNDETLDALRRIAFTCGLGDLFATVPLPPRQELSSQASAVCDSLRPMVIAWRSLSSISQSMLSTVARAVRDMGQLAPEADIAEASRKLSSDDATSSEFHASLSTIVSSCGYRTRVPDLQ